METARLCLLLGNSPMLYVSKIRNPGQNCFCLNNIGVRDMWSFWSFHIVFFNLIFIFLFFICMMYLHHLFYLMLQLVLWNTFISPCIWSLDFFFIFIFNLSFSHFIAFPPLSLLPSVYSHHFHFHSLLNYVLKFFWLFIYLFIYFKILNLF